MNIAIPSWGKRISPLFDEAKQLLIVPHASTGPAAKHIVEITDLSLAQKCLLMKRTRVKTLICGAVSDVYLEKLLASGLRVIPGICGEIETVMNAYRNGTLEDPAFYLPCRKTVGLEASLAGGSRREMQNPAVRASVTKESFEP